MKKNIDFIETNLINFDKILRPTINKTQTKDKKTTLTSFKIQKSFVPQTKSSINQIFRPQIQKLKLIYKKQLQQQKQKKALLAEGKITREELNQQKQIKKQPQIIQEKVIVDQSGQIRDQKGNLIFVKNRTTQLMINKKKQDQIQVKNLAKKQRIKANQKLSRALYDRNLVIGSSKKRIRRSLLGLQFLQKGSYQPAQLKQVINNQIQSLNDVLDTNINDIKIIKKRNIVNLQFNRDIPEVQWWDKDLLKNKTYKQVLGISQQSNIEQKTKIISSASFQQFIDLELLKNQIIYQKVGDENNEKNIILPTYLTKQQKKKLKRKRKQQKLQQKNDKIKLGLIQPDKPRLTIKNMAIVYKNQFILDPSKIQQIVQKQTQQRLDKHLTENSIRKLTKTQKKDKIIRKLKRDSAKQCRRAVFRLGRLTEPSHVFKVNQNAKQMALNGFVIKPNNQINIFPTMILIQGGLRAVKFYKNLLLRRINWAINFPSNECKLIWQGKIQSSTAGKWKYNEVSDEVQAIRLLTEKKMQNYWDYMNV